MAKTSVSRTPQSAAVKSSAPLAIKAPREPDEIMDAHQEASANAFQVAAQSSALQTTEQVLSLQQSVGNQALTQLLQRSSPEGQTSTSFGQPAFAAPILEMIKTVTNIAEIKDSHR